MNQFYGIISEHRCAFSSKNDRSAMLQELGINHDAFDTSKPIVRVKLIPDRGKWWTNPDSWKIVVDQDVVPEWFTLNRKRYDMDIRDAAKEWWTSHVLVDKNIDELTAGSYWLMRCKVKKLANNVRIEECRRSFISAMRDNSFIRTMNDRSKVYEMYNGSRIYEVLDNSKVYEMNNVSLIYGVSDNSEVYTMRDTSRVENLRNRAKVYEMQGTSLIYTMHDKSKVSEMYGNSVIYQMRDNSEVYEMHNDSRIATMHDDSALYNMYDASKIGMMWDNASYHHLEGVSQFYGS